MANTKRQFKIEGVWAKPDVGVLGGLFREHVLNFIESGSISANVTQGEKVKEEVQFSTAKDWLSGLSVVDQNATNAPGHARRHGAGYANQAGSLAHQSLGLPPRLRRADRNLRGDYRGRLQAPIGFGQIFQALIYSSESQVGLEIVRVNGRNRFPRLSRGGHESALEFILADDAASAQSPKKKLCFQP